VNGTGVNTAETRSLAELAHQVLETQIITLQLLPGTLLTEKDLAGITGIGRTPVREAIQRLASDGLLQILPRKGLMVTTQRRTDMVNILEARKVLERLMVVKACERATPDQRQALLVMAEHTGAIGNDPNALLRLIVRIDELLAAACHNSFLVGARASMQSQCLRLWYMYRDETDLLEATRLHAALASMVGEGNGAGAIRALDEIIASLENLVARLDVLS
jgi:DNA-binding GntR family transcriptional regulator